MKNNHQGLFAFSLLLVIMIIATGSYAYAIPADFFFLAGCLSYRRQRRLDGQVRDSRKK